MPLVARRMAVAVVETADSGKVAEQLNGKDSRRSPSVAIGLVAVVAEGHNHQIRHQ
jgi:hypothetical protein